LAAEEKEPWFSEKEAMSPKTHVSPTVAATPSLNSTRYARPAQTTGLKCKEI